MPSDHPPIWTVDIQCRLLVDLCHIFDVKVDVAKNLTIHSDMELAWVDIRRKINQKAEAVSFVT